MRGVIRGVGWGLMCFGVDMHQFDLDRVKLTSGV